jgi:hypothetical protein
LVIIEKALDIGIEHVVHLLLHQYPGQRIIQRLMLAAPRAKPVREAEEVLLIYLIEGWSPPHGGRSCLPGWRFRHWHDAIRV